MAYERPELFVLSSASTAIHHGAGADSNGGKPKSDKAAVVREIAGDNTDANHNATTSSTSGAYEADE